MNKFLQRLRIFLITVLCLSLSLLFVACGEPGEKGDKGDKGDTGAAGVGIVSIAKDSTSGNVDIYKITMSNGSTSTFTVTNGINGTNGSNGSNGQDGQNGQNGQDGADGISVTNAQIINGELVLSFSQGDPINLGKVVGKDGTNGQNGTSLENVTLDNDGNLSVTYGGNTYPLGNVKGNDGKSAYEIYKQYYDYTGTEQQWINDLVNGNLMMDESQPQEIDHQQVLPEVLDKLFEEMHSIKGAGKNETKDIFIGSGKEESAIANTMMGAVSMIAPLVRDGLLKVGTSYQSDDLGLNIKTKIEYQAEDNKYIAYFCVSEGENEEQEFLQGIIELCLDKQMSPTQMTFIMTMDKWQLLSAESYLLDFVNNKEYCLNIYANEQAKENYIAELKTALANWIENKGDIVDIDIYDYMVQKIWYFTVYAMNNCRIMVNFDEQSYVFEEDYRTCFYQQQSPEIVAIPDEGYIFVMWSDGVKDQKRIVSRPENENEYAPSVDIYPIVVQEDLVDQNEYVVVINNPEWYSIAYENCIGGEIQSTSGGYNHYKMLIIGAEDESTVIKIYATENNSNWALTVGKPVGSKIVIVNVPDDLQVSDTYFDPNAC